MHAVHVSLSTLVISQHSLLHDDCVYLFIKFPKKAKTLPFENVETACLVSLNFFCRGLYENKCLQDSRSMALEKKICFLYITLF